MKTIPIPHEIQSQSKNASKKTIPVIQQVHLKLQEKVHSKDEKHLEKTCFKMMKYLANDGMISLSEVKELTYDLERSVICLQRKKKKLIEKAHKKGHK